MSPVPQPVGLKVAVQGEDATEATPFGERDQRGVSKIHRPIGIAVHQGGSSVDVVVVHGRDFEIAALDQSPQCLLRRPPAASK